MAFKTYTDKTSLRKKQSRMLQGGTADFDATYIRWWEREVFEEDDQDFEFIVTAVYEQNPDLIAYDFYGRNGLSWVVLQYNNIVDVNEELAVGKTIFLPSRSRVFLQFLSKPIIKRVRNSGR